MNISLFKLCKILGIPPRAWMIPNPFKIYEFSEVVSASGLRREDSILDLGCGKGHWTLLLAGRCRRAIGVDTSESTIAIARRFLRNSSLKNRVEFFCAPLEEIHFPEASLDRVFSFSVLEHIENLQEILIEVFRILKPGGQLHVSVDSLASIKDKALLNRHMQVHLSVRCFTETSLRQQLEKVGFEVIDIYPIFKGEFAREEFKKRILGSYKKNLVVRLRYSKRFLQEDRRLKEGEGIMLIGRARRP